MRKCTARRVTDGARLLRAYLIATGQSVPAFCESHRIDRIQTQRALNGEIAKISVGFALQIFRATQGAVPVHTWDPGTATSEVPQRRRRTGTDDTR